MNGRVSGVEVDGGPSANRFEKGTVIVIVGMPSASPKDPRSEFGV